MIICSLCKVMRNMDVPAVLADYNPDKTVRYAWCEACSHFIDEFLVNKFKRITNESME